MKASLSLQSFVYVHIGAQANILSLPTHLMASFDGYGAVQMAKMGNLTVVVIAVWVSVISSTLCTQNKTQTHIAAP